jgi:ABC-2 type transport system permease protein
MSNTFRSYLLMVRWQLLSARTILPFVLVIQIIIAVGTVFGLSYMYPSIDVISAKYIVTGATMMTLATLGLVMVPQSVAQMKEKKTFDYLWSLPLPRLVYLLADFTIWTAIVLPGVILSLAIGSAKYHFSLDISPLVVPAFLLIALTSVAVGMSFAHLSPSPVLTGVITNVIIFSLFLFSPVNFPIERLPFGVYHIHLVLPIKYMADLVRGTVTPGLVDNLGTAFAIVGAWCIVSMIILYRVFTRRR